MFGGLYCMLVWDCVFSLLLHNLIWIRFDCLLVGLMRTYSIFSNPIWIMLVGDESTVLLLICASE